MLGVIPTVGCKIQIAEQKIGYDSTVPAEFPEIALMLI